MSFSVFGPLDKSYCVIFYIFTVVSFILVCGGVIGGLSVITTKRVDYKTSVAGIVIFFNLVLTYFIYRLLHTICIKSL